MSDEKQFCTFTLQGLLFGINVLEVQEVFRYQEMTSVPLAPNSIKGLINLRGQIITAIDLRNQLHLEGREEGEVPMNVVVRTADDVVSLLVDQIGDVMEVPQNIFEAPPENIQGPLKQLVRGVYKLEKGLLLILDTDRAVQMPAAA